MTAQEENIPIEDIDSITIMRVLTVEQIIEEYGEFFTEKQIESLKKVVG